MKYILYLLLILSCRCFAWGVNGHLLVAEIAWQHLTPQTRSQVQRLTKTFARAYPRFRYFTVAADWPDNLRHNGVHAFDAWHFINMPLSYSHSTAHHYTQYNVVWAIKQSEQVLRSKTATNMSKAIFLMFLVHFVADAHQPLHCVNFYSKRFPNGDKGGNLFLIKTAWAKNLHQYWDKGGDFFWQQRHSVALNRKGIKRLAIKIQRDYPESYFATKTTVLHPKIWVRESYDIAKDFAYHVKYNSVPSKVYQGKTQVISEKRVALAGYRLANILNQLLI